jgi:flagellar hook-length control protein FliK
VHLQPADLGAVSIRVGKTGEGTATVAVTVERSDTLATLQADLGHLHQALDRAGVSDNRSVTIHLAASSDTGSGLGQGRSQAGEQGFAAGNGSTFGQGGSAAGGQQGQPRQTAHAPAPSGPHGDAPSTLARPAPTPTRRAGVNITA